MDAILAIPQPNESGLLAFVGLSHNRSSRLSRATDQTVKGIVEILDGMLLSAIAKRTKADFAEIRTDIIPKYFQALRAMSDLLRIIVPRPVLEGLVYESFSELETDFREKGLDRFGAEVRDQAIFTIWTFRKVSKLVSLFSGVSSTSEDSAKQEEANLLRFVTHLCWSQFHLDCLIAAMRFDMPIYPEVRSEIQDGLRAAVNAYALARQEADFRLPVEERALKSAEWDEEDQELLDSSMQDLETELKCADGD